MQQPLQVGIIGAGAERGWARASHVPAVQKLSGLEVGVLVSGSQARSDAAAKAFRARAAYGDSAELVRDPSIDIVSLCVKVTDHRDLVLSAIKAGEHIYCEWPLGRNMTETEELAAAAKAASVHVAKPKRQQGARRCRFIVESLHETAPSSPRQGCSARSQ